VVALRIHLDSAAVSTADGAQRHVLEHLLNERRAFINEAVRAHLEFSDRPWQGWDALRSILIGRERELQSVRERSVVRLTQAGLFDRRALFDLEVHDRARSRFNEDITAHLVPLLSPTILVHTDILAIHRGEMGER
jgi:hypothetical protein